MNTTTVTAVATPDADRIAETADKLAGRGNAIAKIVDGLIEIAHADHDLDSTSTMLSVLGGGGHNGGGSVDVLQLLALVVQRLGNPDSNPALRDLSPARIAAVSKLTRQYVDFDRDFAPKELLNEASAYADPYSDGEPPEGDDQDN